MSAPSKEQLHRMSANERVKFARSYTNGLANITKGLNVHAQNHLNVMFGLNAQLKKEDPSKDSGARLMKMVNELKTIRYKCNNTIARDQDRITVIRTNGASGYKGPSVNLDVVPNCLVVCRVNLEGRKAPLRLNIAQMHNGKII